jgi:hypothetical protein
LISIFFLDRRKAAIASFFVFWIVFAIFLPSLSSKYIVNKTSQLPSEEKINITKFSELQRFNKEQRLKIAREIITRFFNEASKTNEDIELANIRDIMKIISLENNISLAFPSTFYLLIQNEISARSYRSYIDFLRYILDLREDFLKFYLDKKYFSKAWRVESFIKGDENIFRAESRLPENFWAGVGITGNVI